MLGDFGLMVIYFSLALGVSFLCSILEAVLLSITPQYVALSLKQKPKTGHILKDLKSDIHKPLTAILTLNTIAHTMGAAGVGAKVTKIYGNEYLTISSVILTLLILFFSEIIPKTIGTNYWQLYAKFTAYFCYYITRVLSPVIWISKIFTKVLIGKKKQQQFQRDEFNAITELAIEQGVLLHDQGQILKQLLRLDTIEIKDILTPQSVLFCLNANTTIEQYFHQHDDQTFSRIPIYQDNIENMVGFVMRDDLLLSQARGNGDKALSDLKRNIYKLLDTTHLLQAFSIMIKNKYHISIVINNYDEMLGIITLEDILEHLIGYEIVDEHDQYEDMQKLADKIKNKQEER